MYYEVINHATKDYPFLIEHINVKYIPHFHADPEVVYVMEGSLGVTIENKSFTLNRGEICIFTPELIHNLYSHQPNKTFVMKLFPLIDLRNIQLQSNIIRPHDKVYGELLENIQCMMKENREKAVGYELSVNICAQKILLAIIRDIEHTTMEKTTRANSENKCDFLNSVTAFLDTHYSEGFSLEQIASHLNYTKSYFCHRFKRISGVTFWKYYTIYRLEKSIQMMKSNPNKKYIEIASDCGFKNVRSFNQAFREYHHCTPREYLKKHYSSHTI